MKFLTLHDAYISHILGISAFRLIPLGTTFAARNLAFEAFLPLKPKHVVLANIPAHFRYAQRRIV
jgi:hypothetical protein